MKSIKLFIISALIVAGFLTATSCSQTSLAGSSAGIVLVGSTPGDPAIKSMLGIAPEAKVDFIRWELTLNTENAKIFSLNAIYGEAKQNTRGFIEDKKLSLAGKYSISQKAGGKINTEIYQLKSDHPQTTLSLVKLSDGLFHILTADNKLMAGNGGWSYTLNRKGAAANSSASLPVLSAPPALPNDKAAEVIFSGRTPCGIAAELKIEVPEGCFKLKWKLTLKRDPQTFEPTTYTLQRPLHRQTTIEGKWTAKKGSGANTDAVIYQLDPDKPAESMSFLLADENVMLFLDKNQRLLVGNYEFSYTLDKRATSQDPAR